uniref:CYP750C26 n=1 Tax=Taxus chinensis TaxID=29808 RepID=A0A291FB34_TAXCH|nr:CYP750C26 [Taxus chinensis]
MAYPELLENLSGDRAQSPAIAAVLTILFLLGIFYILRGLRNNGRRLPPGPIPWPIVGNLHQLGKLPNRNLEELAKKHGPIMLMKLGSVPAVIVSSSAMAKEVLKTHDLVFASRPESAAGKYIAYNYKDIVFSPYGPYWRQMKKICVVELLNARRIESLRSVREEEVSVIIRSVWEKSKQGAVAVNLSKTLSSLTQGLMLQIFSSNDDGGNSSVTAIKEMMSEVSETAGAFNIGDYFPWMDWMDLQGIQRRMTKAHDYFDQVITKIIEQHQRTRAMEDTQQPKDIIDALLQMENTDGVTITMENIKAVVLGIFLGGAETTSTTLEWAMSAMLENPEVAKKVQEEIESVVGRERVVKESDLGSMEYLQCVVKETMRLYPAVPLLIPHESTQDCTVNGYFIPERTRILVNAWAIGRDPTVWDDALAFKPERFLGRNVDLQKGKEFFDMVPFGAGRRGCPGASMAVVTMELALAQLMHCFQWRIEGELDMSERFAASLQRKVDLCVVPQWRLTSSP